MRASLPTRQSDKLWRLFERRPSVLGWRPWLLGARTLLGAPGLTIRNKKLLGAPGIATRNKDATRAIGISLEAIAIKMTIFI